MGVEIETVYFDGLHKAVKRLFKDDSISKVPANGRIGFLALDHEFLTLLVDFGAGFGSWGVEAADVCEPKE
jgi:hypothetical protein